MQTDSPDSVLTLGDAIAWGEAQFKLAGLHFGHGTDNAWDEAAWLVLHAMGLPVEQVHQKLGLRLTDADKINVFSLLRARVEQRRPAAYVTGEAFFAGLRFYVDERVLVPRSPIAELIEVGFEPWIEAQRVRRILDLCTGSGCIGIACAVAFPGARVDLSDVCPDALAVARKNVSRHNLGRRARVIQSDLFERLEGKRYDIIVSNPPYVDQASMRALAAEYRYEPDVGLRGGPDGLELVSRILRKAGVHLNPNGLLVVEVGGSDRALQKEFARVPFMWLEFEHGGEGVFVLTAEQCMQYF